MDEAREGLRSPALMRWKVDREQPQDMALGIHLLEIVYEGHVSDLILGNEAKAISKRHEFSFPLVSGPLSSHELIVQRPVQLHVHWLQDFIDEAAANQDWK
jgi:hypothetical protein